MGQKIDQITSNVSVEIIRCISKIVENTQLQQVMSAQK